MGLFSNVLFRSPKIYSAATRNQQNEPKEINQRLMTFGPSSCRGKQDCLPCREAAMIWVSFSG
jgi:hypothetical protein